MPLFDPHHSQTPYTSTPSLHAQHQRLQQQRGEGQEGHQTPLDKFRLPPGCTPGPVLHLVPVKPGKNGKPPKVKVVGPSSDEAPPDDSEPCPIIWVDFPSQSKENPFYFSRRRKWMILAVALYFAHVTALQTSAYSIGFGSMQRDLGMTDLQAATGVSLYGWGFAVGPLCLAPISEEFGRYWTYVPAVLVYGLCHLFLGLGKNVATVLVGRWFQGLSGCIGATVVAGTVSDLYPPAKRGLPMSIFTFWVTLGPGLAPVIFSWVEANSRFEWRWIQWFQMITFGAYFPIVVLVLRETRATVLLRRKAKKLRDERGMQDGGRYVARSEVNKLDLGEAMKRSLSRPLMFLALEPVVLFFAIWAALAWGVFFIQVAALPTVMKIVHGFNVTQSGLTYISLCLGTCLGFALNFVQDRLYKRNVGQHGVEARLYAAMAAGPGLAVGCIIFGLTAIESVHWIAPCVGLVIILMSAYTIYQACFVYLSECYGSHASSAVAAMSFLRILLGSSFPMFTNQMFDTLTPRWSLFMMGCIALLLAPVPYIAYFKGPWIRSRSPYSKILMAEEKKRVELEAGLKEAEKDDVEMQRQQDNEAEVGSQVYSEAEAETERGERTLDEKERKREKREGDAGEEESGMRGRRQESWTSNSSSTLHDQQHRQ